MAYVPIFGCSRDDFLQAHQRSVDANHLLTANLPELLSHYFLALD
jgi:hypothetical protein